MENEEVKYFGIKVNNEIPKVYKVNKYKKNVELNFKGTAYLIEYKDDNIEKTELKDLHKFKKNGKYRVEFINTKEECYIINIEIKKSFLFILLLFIAVFFCLFMLFLFPSTFNRNYNRYWKDTIYSLIDVDKENIYEFDVSFFDRNLTKEIKLDDTLNKKIVKKNKICPGVSGSFAIVISTKESNVDMNYEIEFKDLTQEKPKNLVFKIRGDNLQYSSLQDLEKRLKGLINRRNTTKVIIDWEWPYESKTDVSLGDKVDTLEGETLNTYKFLINVQGTEVVYNE